MQSKIPFSPINYLWHIDTLHIIRALQIHIYYIWYIRIYQRICIVVSDSGGASLAPRLPRPLFASLPSVHRSVLNPCSRNSSQQQSASLFWLRRRRRILIVRVSTQFAVHINIYTTSLCSALPFSPDFWHHPDKVSKAEHRDDGPPYCSTESQSICPRVCVCVSQIRSTGAA